MKVNDIQFKDYYAIAMQKKNSDTAVINYTEYETLEEAYKEAKAQSEFDVVHIYSVKHIQKFERYIDDCFYGIVNKSETIVTIK